MRKLLGSLLILAAAFAGMIQQSRQRRWQRQTRLDLLNALRRIGEEIRLQERLCRGFWNRRRSAAARRGAFFLSLPALSGKERDFRRHGRKARSFFRCRKKNDGR